MDRGEDYEQDTYSQTDNRHYGNASAFRQNRHSRFGDNRAYRSEFSYGQNRQNFRPAANRGQRKPYVEPTDYMDFHKSKNIKMPRRTDCKVDELQAQMGQNCKSTKSYRGEIKRRDLGGHYPEQRINFQNMDEQIRNYWNNSSVREGDSNDSKQIRSNKQQNHTNVRSQPNQQRGARNRNYQNRLEDIQQIAQPSQRSNLINNDSGREGSAKLPEEQKNQNEDSSSWIKQEDILHELSKPSSNLSVRKQDISNIGKELNPSYISSIEGASSSHDSNKNQAENHQAKRQKDNRLNIHKLLQQEDQQEEQIQQARQKEVEQEQEQQDQADQQQPQTQQKEQIPQLSLIAKQQIISKIQLSKKFEQRDLQIQFICKKNILQLKIKEVYLTKLELSAKIIQQRDGSFSLLTNPEIQTAVLEQYVHFTQISQCLPRLFQAQPKMVEFDLCKIRVPVLEQPKVQKSKEFSFIKKVSKPQGDSKCSLDWQLVQIKKMQLNCMNCNHSNVVPIIYGDLSASLSCKECSESMEIQIVKLSGQ